MKKYLKVMLVISLAVLMVACGKDEKAKKELKTIDISKTKEVVLYNLSFVVPEEYVESDYSSEDFIVYSAKDDTYDLYGCDFESYLYEPYVYDEEIDEDVELDDSIESLIETRLLEEFYNPYTIEHKVINGHNWTYAVGKSLPQDDGNIFMTGMYVAEYNNERYVFTYDDAHYEKGTCKAVIDQTLNSLTLK